jgi:hypothetical protein
MKEEIPVISTASSTSPTATTSSICINALWFSSLVLSLNTVLGAILAKQWLSEYELVTCSTSKSPREQVPLRQLKFDSFGRWGIPTIIDYLPVQLIFALFLFFAGLVYFVWTLNATVAIITSVCVGISALCFLATTFLPSFFELCAFCSPQSWLFFYLSKRLQRLFSQPHVFEVYSFTDAWIDAFTTALSRPSEARMNETRALNWIHATMGSWESSLVPSLYRCALSLPASDTAEVICKFWGSTPSAIADRQIYVNKLWTDLGAEVYWQVYANIRYSIQSKRGTSSKDETPLIMIFCSLNLVLCEEFFSYDEKSEILLPGLTLLAKILQGHGLSLPLDTKLSMAATLFHIGAQKNLSFPKINRRSLDSFTEALIPNHTTQETAAFLSLSSVCIRFWSRMLDRTSGSNIHLTYLTKLLTAMQSAVRSGENSVGAVITHWMLFGISSSFVEKMVKINDKDAIGALQELALCFRKAYDDGIGLADSIVARIDVLIVAVCSVEVRYDSVSRHN